MSDGKYTNDGQQRILRVVLALFADVAPMASANSPTCGHPKLGQARTAGL